MRTWRPAFQVLVFAASAAALRCAAAPSTENAAPGATLRVMTYNIRAGNDLERRSNLARIAAMIDSLRADFVMLQEVDRLTMRSRRVDQAAVLASYTAMQFAFGRALDYDGGEYGLAVLSRWPIEVIRVVPLEIVRPRESVGQNPEPRALLHVMAATPAGRIHLVTTHLDQGSDPSARQPQLLRLLAYVADSIPRGERLVLGGDLNALPGAPEIRALGIAFDDAWPACGRGSGLTFRSDRPERRIDYVLLAGVRCSAAEVIGSRLSDHLPLVVDVVIGRQ